MAKDHSDEASDDELEGVEEVSQETNGSDETTEESTETNEDVIEEVPADVEESAVPKASKPKKNRKKFNIVVLVLLLVAAAVGAWYLFFKDDQTKVTDSDKPVKEVAQDQPAKLPKLDKLFYTFAENSSSTSKLYYRPASGGDRAEVADAGKYDDVAYGGSDVAGNRYVFIGGEGQSEVWAGESVQKPKKVYDLDGSQTNLDDLEFLTAIDLTDDGKKIAVGHTTSTTNTVKTMNFDGSGAATAFDTDKEGTRYVFANNGLTKFVYATGCVGGCDGPASAPKLYDKATKKSKELLSVDSSGLTYPTIAPDFSSLSIVEATVDKTKVVDGLPGFYVGKPFKVHVVNLTDASDKVVATLAEGTSEANIRTGFVYTLGGLLPYYTDGDKLMQVNKDGTTTVLFDNESGGIGEVYFASEEEVLVGIQKDDYTIDRVVYFNIDDKKVTDVASLNQTTFVIGATYSTSY